MNEFDVMHASDFEPDNLQHALAVRIAEGQAREFRTFFLIRMAFIVAGAWVLSWPVHLLPHTVLWALLATAALVIGLTSPARSRPASPGTPSTRLRRGR